MSQKSYKMSTRDSSIENIVNKACSTVMQNKIMMFYAFFIFVFLILCLCLSPRNNNEKKIVSMKVTATPAKMSFFRNMINKLMNKFKDNLCYDIQTVKPEEFYKDVWCKGHRLCKTNHMNPLLYVPDKNDCKDIEKCVTLVVKTSGERNAKLVELIESVWKYFPSMKMVIIADDIVIKTLNPKLEKYIKQSDQIIFKQLDTVVGLAGGRMIGLRHVKTPYFLLSDDDMVFNEQTDIKTLFDILVSTNVSLVAGNTDKCNFFGLLKFRLNGTRRVLEHHDKKIYAEIEGFPECYHVDIAKNIFMGKMDIILGVGGWTEWLMVSEHEDLFLKLKLKGMSVAVCPNVYFEHRQVNDRIRFQRKYSFQYFHRLLKEKWQLDEIIHVF